MARTPVNFSLPALVAMVACLLGSDAVFAQSQSYRPVAPHYSQTQAPQYHPPQQQYPPQANPVVPAAYYQPEQLDASQGIPLSPPNKQTGLPLSPQSDKSTDTGLSAVIGVVGSLAVVLGIFFVVAWGVRRAAPKGSNLLPNEVLEVLGRAPLAHRQQVSLVRCGSKLLLVCTTPNGAETLTEITEPIEVDRIAGLCKQAQPGSATAAFRQVLQQMTTGKMEVADG